MKDTRKFTKAAYGLPEEKPNPLAYQVTLDGQPCRVEVVGKSVWKWVHGTEPIRHVGIVYGSLTGTRPSFSIRLEELDSEQ